MDKSIVKSILILILILCMLSSCSKIPQKPLQENTPDVVNNNTDIMVSFKVDEGEKLDAIVDKIANTFNLQTDKVKFEMENSVGSTLMNPSQKDYKRFEGIIVPKVYTFKEGTPLNEVLLSMVRDSEDRYTRIEASAKDKNTLKPFERVILASIIEKECIANRQYSEVASVFLNRLSRNNKLQSCVTVEYALGFERPFLTSDDIKVDSPYNTYKIKGLPPTAISVFDDSALAAAIQQPANDKICYFVYDYIDNNIEFSSDYNTHKAIAEKIYKKYIQNSKIPPHDKVVKGQTLQTLSK